MGCCVGVLKPPLHPDSNLRRRYLRRGLRAKRDAARRSSSSARCRVSRAARSLKRQTALREWRAARRRLFPLGLPEPRRRALCVSEAQQHIRKEVPEGSCDPSARLLYDSRSQKAVRSGPRPDRSSCCMPSHWRSRASPNSQHSSFRRVNHAKRARKCVLIPLGSILCTVAAL